MSTQGLSLAAQFSHSNPWNWHVLWSVAFVSMVKLSSSQDLILLPFSNLLPAASLPPTTSLLPPSCHSIIFSLAHFSHKQCAAMATPAMLPFSENAQLWSQLCWKVKWYNKTVTKKKKNKFLIVNVLLSSPSEISFITALEQLGITPQNESLDSQKSSQVPWLSSQFQALISFFFGGEQSWVEDPPFPGGYIGPSSPTALYSQRTHLKNSSSNVKQERKWRGKTVASWNSSNLMWTVLSGIHCNDCSFRWVALSVCSRKARGPCSPLKISKTSKW